MEQIRYWKKLERHPLSAEYLDIDRTQMRADLKEFGNVDGRKIVVAPDESDGNKIKVLEGWQFYQCHIDLDIKPTFQPLKKGLSAEDLVRIKNEDRRHETPEITAARIEKRRERVTAAREEGKSLRTIAKEEDISPVTVRRDLEAAGGSGGPPETNGTPPTVTGADGKQYPAKKKEKILCQRCERIAKPYGIKGCPACEDLNRSDTVKKREPKPDASPDDAPKDCFGSPIPKNCRDVFGDAWLRETFDFLSVTSENVRKKRISEGLLKRAKRLPMINSKDFVDGVGFVIQYLDDLINHIKDNRPEALCPECKGEGCTHCKRVGMVSRKLHKELKAKSAK